ncbi:MAG: mechanosensitive ion channel family protein [Luteolibacter sp.]
MMAKSSGLVIAVHAVIWLAFLLPFRRIKHPPRFSLHAFAFSLGVWLAGRVFFPDENWGDHVGAILIFTTALFLWCLFDRIIIGTWLPQRGKIPVPIILRQLGGVLVVLVAGSAILKWGYRLELTGLLATSGIAAVILGFAMQDLLSNVIAGFSIHMTRAYRVGDWLLLGDNGNRAEVTEINWRSTRLINNDQISFEIPNSEIVKNRIVNLNYPTAEHGVRMRFGLDYDVPPSHAKQAILAAVGEAQGVIESPAPMVFLHEFGDSSIIYELRIWMRHARLYNATCDEIRTALWYELKRRNIRIPFPIQTLDIRKSNEPEHFADAKSRAAEIVGSKALNCLNTDEAAELVKHGKISLYGTREPLVTRGHAGESMFVILDGGVEVVGKTGTGPRIILARLGPGEFFGEMSLLTGAPRNATVRAELDTLVLEIRKKDLSPLIEANPELAGRLGELVELRQQKWTEALHGNPDESETKTPEGPQKRSFAERIRIFFSQENN